VRRKLAAVLIIPAVAFLALGGLAITTSVDRATKLAAVERQIALGRQVSGLVHEIQRERDRTAGYLAVAGRDGPDSAGAKQLLGLIGQDRQAVDRAAEAYRSALPAVRDATDDAGRSRFATADTALADLPALRAATGNGLRQRAVFEQYSQLVAALLDVAFDAAQGTEFTGDLARDVVTLRDLYQANEFDARIRGRLYAIAESRGFGHGEVQEFADLRAQRADARARFRADAPAEVLATHENVVKGQATLAAIRIEQSAVDRYQAASLDVDPEQWWAASSTALELVHTAAQVLLDHSVDEAQEQSEAQWRQTGLYAAIIAVILLVAVLASLVMSRSMVRSLGTLRDQALTVARKRLPEALRVLSGDHHNDQVIEVQATTVDSLDEIGEVADAFDAVHREAVRLGVEQARLRRNDNGMFVNLARRSQVLVERQLTVIERLEADEADPDQLTSLFTLDHLATRMRRNDENLLVLAGSDSSRRWAEPVGLPHVLMAAIAEIEQYPRARTQAPEEIAIVGHAVADVVHLLAELLENATEFSPPSTTVQITGHAIRNGTEAVITVEDRGIGMSPQVLASANQRLAEPPRIDVSVSERMGLFVVSRLAARQGIHVHLRPAAPEGGILATVWLPARLLAVAPRSFHHPVVGRPVPTEAAGNGAGPHRVLTPVYQPTPAAPNRRVRPRAEDVLIAGGARADRRGVW